MLTSEMVTAVKTEGGFDSTASATSDAVVLSWLNQKYREMVAESKWLKVTRDMGPTVADQSQYEIDDDVVDVRTIRVDGSRPWSLATIEGLWELQASTVDLASDTVGVFAPNFTSTQTAVIELYPTPEEAGLEIEALVAILPAALTTSPDATPAVPVDVHQAVVDGAIGLGLGRVYERHDEALPYEARFQAAIAKLSRRQRSRVGSGPVRFPVE